MIKDLFTPLSEEELDFLDQFLLDRIDEDTVTKDKDEGIYEVSGLDGFFTAIVSGPTVIQPSRWLPQVWGDFEPVWHDEQQFELVLGLLMRHMNSIAVYLTERSDDFEPLFMERIVKGKTYPIVDDWCEGYVRGVALSKNLWHSDSTEMMTLLMPIRAFTSETDWAAHSLPNKHETDNVRKAIVPNVRQIHEYWLSQREHDHLGPRTIVRTEPRVGRNDPCPCGSGKKFKKCCLH